MFKAITDGLAAAFSIAVLLFFGYLIFAAFLLILNFLGMI